MASCLEFLFTSWCCLPEVYERLETFTSFVVAEGHSYLVASLSVAFDGQKMANILKLTDPLGFIEIVFLIN